MVMQRVPAGVVLTIAVTGVIVSVLAAGLLMAYQRIPNSGNVKTVGVGVYWDSACTDNVTSIDWGFLEPGATVNRTVYIRNEGNTPLVLNMTTDNWNPTSTSGYVFLNWNLEGCVVNTTVPVVQAVLTLSVSSDVSGVTGFSFDIIITGTEQM